MGIFANCGAVPVLGLELRLLQLLLQQLRGEKHVPSHSVVFLRCQRLATLLPIHRL